MCEDNISAAATHNTYLDRSDWRTNENANQGFSINGLRMNSAGKVDAVYWLTQVYPKHIADAHANGDIHIHNLSLLGGYCAGWSLRDLLMVGFGGISDKVSAGPPKHLQSALGQIVSFIGTLQNEWAGAQALSSLDTYLAPLVKEDRKKLYNELSAVISDKDTLNKTVDRLQYKRIEEDLQFFLFNLNQSSRWGGQVAFSNVTFDLTVPKDMVDQHPIIANTVMDYTYRDCQAEMDVLNEIFVKLFMQGDQDGRIFSFPIPTYNITDDFDWDCSIAASIFELTAKYGVPYFQNFINSDLNPSDTRSMCCRLRLDKRELLKRNGGLFGSGELTGSIGVCTINCARIGYLCRAILREKGIGAATRAIYEKLDYLLEICKESLEIKRKWLIGQFNNGLYPFTAKYLHTEYRNHFSTIGVNGMNEMISNLTLGVHDITTSEGRQLAIDVLTYIRYKIIEFQEETGNLYNLEATPAEGTSYRFAKKDKELYPDIFTSGTEQSPYYTNSTQLPVNFTPDIFEALNHQEELQKLYTGGTVFHAYLGETISGAMCKELVKTILSKYKIPYLSITPTFSICPEHGYINGNHSTCPKCGSSCEVWTRVVGFYRPVSNFNIGKKQEFADRVYFGV